MVLVYGPGRHRALQFFDGFEDTQPNDFALRIALSREGISALHGLNGGAITVAVNEQLGGAPEVEVINHSLAIVLTALRRLIELYDVAVWVTHKYCSCAAWKGNWTLSDANAGGFKRGLRFVHVTDR